MVASVAGYNVVEVNASDERAGDAVVAKIAAALDNDQIVLSARQKRPNMVIVDEIDGALCTASDHGLVRFLLRLVRGSRDDGADGTEKHGTSSSQLRRPIVCICNDL